MNTPARDQAIDFTIGLCTALVRRLGLRLDDRIARLVARFIDLVIAAVIERLDQDEGDDLDVLLEGADRPRFGPLQEQYQIQAPSRRKYEERRGV